jgi:Derlin-2/3
MGRFFGDRFVMVALLCLAAVLGTTVAKTSIFPSRATTTPVFGGVSTIAAYRGMHSRKQATLLTALLQTRGGSDEEDPGEESEEEEEDFDDEDGVFDDLEMGEDGDDDFDEDTMVDRLVDAYIKTPPLTKGYLTASFMVTAMGYFFNKNEFPELLVLDWKKTITRGQLWRPFTTFFNFGPFGLGYVMTIHFVHTYMSTLERLHHRKPYDFWIMIAFGMLSMVFGYPFLKLNARFLGHNLSTFLVYVWSRYHEGLDVKIFDLYTTRAEILPWFFLAQVRTELSM